MRLMTTLLSLCLATVALAGCADDAPVDANPDDLVDKDDFQFDANQGAIAGLLVDDRFRPIDLEPEGSGAGEFQAHGFVLIQETGQQLRTNENGEFQALNLEPGTYTIRVQSDRHEATPQKVQVTAGEFADMNIVARRVATGVEAILTTEFSIFIPCAAYATAECPPDMSGETYRPGISYNYEELADEIDFAVIEVLANQGGIYCFEVRTPGAAGTSGDQHYVNECTEQDGRYMRAVLVPGENYMQDGEDPWDPATNQQGILFYFGNNELTCWNELTGSDIKRCVGVGFGIKAQIIFSVFVGDDVETDRDSYCVLC